MRSESDGNFANVAAEGRPRRAWFTDTLNDVNGVAMTIRKMAAAAAQNDQPITVVTSIEGATETAFPHVNDRQWFKRFRAARNARAYTVLCGALVAIGAVLYAVVALLVTTFLTE